jgi:hypothetical protein
MKYLSRKTHHSDIIKIGKYESDPMNLDNGVRQGSVLSPFLFIVYINPLIQKLVGSNIGLQISAFAIHNKIPCFMFVDDLILLTDKLIDINTLLKLIMNHGAETGCIINLDKGVTIFSSKPDSNIKQYCIDHPLDLTPGDQYIYLGACLRPKARSNLSHISHRTSKLHKMAFSMISRGLHASKIGRETCTTIYNSILGPSLTASMEAFNLSQKEMLQLDSSLANILKHTHNSPGKSHTLWRLWEEDIKPPSSVIQKSILNTYHRIQCMSPNNILRQIYMQTTPNSLTNIIQKICTLWQAEDIIPFIEAKPSKHLMKRRHAYCLQLSHT